MPLIKKIVITGPESSGKTTLAQQLATHFSTQWVPEFARTYLEQLDRPYEREDLLSIARGQAEQEDLKSLQASEYLFCDTGLEVIKIWSLVKFRQIDPQIEQLLVNRCYHHYLLCQPDLSWEPDPLRETPEPKERWLLYQYYQQELTQAGIPWTEISGQGNQRLQQAIKTIDHAVWQIS